MNPRLNRDFRWQLVTVTTNMSRTLLSALLILAITHAALAWGAVSPASPIELGDIPSRPVPPEWPFKRFFQIRPISDLGFSPDNQTLYFIRNDDEVDNIFAIDLRSGAMRQVTHFKEPVQSLLAGRKGIALFYIQDKGGNEQYNIYRYALQTGRVTQLTHAARNDMAYICDLSQDGSRLYYGQSTGGRSRSDLWQLDTATGERKIILSSQGRLLECGEVSPDGRFLVFYEFIENNERYLGLVDLAANQQRYIFRQQQVNNFNATFAGHRLYFMNAMGSDNFYIWQYDIDSGSLSAAGNPLPFPLQSFSLQSDARLAVFYYRANLTTKTAIFVDRSRNRVSYQLPEENLVDAIFSETDPEIAIFITADATQPERYYLHNANGLKLIYDANESGITPEQFAESRSLTVRSFDGLPIPVHLFIPNGTSTQSPKPLLLWIHGGPEEYIDPDFNSYFQFLANHGFIVAAPNVRGSNGFGKRYAMLDNGDWGGGHVRDSIAVARYLSQLDFVDGDRLFVFGESFGGFSVLSAITQYPDTFSGAIVFFGISELASFLENLPRYVDKYLIAQMGFDPRLDKERNRAISPWYHVDRIRIPVQIHQGKNDFRVAKKQTDLLVERMKSAGLAVEYFVYEDEGHGFMRFSNEALAYGRMLEFLQHHATPNQ